MISLSTEMTNNVIYWYEFFPHMYFLKTK